MEHLNEYENRSLFYSTLALLGTFLWMLLKILLGIFTTKVLIVSALFQAVVLISRIYSIIVIKNRHYAKKIDYYIIGTLLIISSIVYMLYMSLADLTSKQYSEFMGILYAVIAFTEITFAIRGLFKTKRGVPLFKVLKLLSLSTSITAMVLAAVSICSFADTENAMGPILNYSGLIAGALILVIGIYILFCHKIGLDNKLFSYNGSLNGKEIKLTSSKFYSNYYFDYKEEDGIVVGKVNIGHNPIFKYHIVWKIFYIILSEILIFPYFIGYIVFSIKNRNLSDKLNIILKEEGLILTHHYDPEYERIYEANLNDNIDLSFIEDALPLNIKEKYNKITDIKYYKISILGYFLLVRAIYDYYGFYYFPDFKEGKPFDNNLDFNFNITHSKDKVILIVSKDDVGIDLEYYKEVSRSLKERLFKDDKLSDKNAIIKWTKLESIYKLEGNGVSINKKIDLKKYKVKTHLYEDYVISIAKYRTKLNLKFWR